MKKSFVNCWIMPGGVLNVFIDLIESETFSEAKIFTIFSDRSYLHTKHGDIEIITALPKTINKVFLKFTNKSSFLSSIFDYRNLMFFYIPLMKILTKKIEKYSSPKVIISSFAVAKNLEFCKKTYYGTFKPITYLYLHSPMQYIRSHYEEYTQKLKGYKSIIFQYLVPKLRKRDKQYNNYDIVQSNSKYTAGLAKKLYNIESNISYPKINNLFLSSNVNESPNNYYIYVGRLVKFVKELDKVIELFNITKEPLLIMGEGPDGDYLKSIAGSNIIFIGRISDTKEKLDIIKNSKGLVNITKESFGICTVEALILGVPVLAYNDGASSELINSESGVLVPNKDLDTLLKYFKEFSSKKWNRKKIGKNMKFLLSNNYQ